MAKWTKARARAYSREWNARNREKRNEVNRKYRAANRDRLNAERRKHRAKNRRRYSLYGRAWRYGLTVEQVRAMLKRGRCAICGTKKHLHIDHCHARKKVRGVLCQRCNMGLGLFRDNPKFLDTAARYVRRA